MNRRPWPEVDGGRKERSVGGGGTPGTNHSRPRDADEARKSSTSASSSGADWLWDAKVAFTDGVRLAVHGGDGDGDDEGLLCEWTAQGMEMSGAGLALGGGDPSPASTSATASCVVTGVRLAVATTSSASTSTSTSTSAAAAAAAATALRPVFRVDKFGGKWGVVAQSAQSAAAESAAAEYAADLEITGATLDVTCADAATLDANFLAAVSSLKASAAKLRPPRKGKGNKEGEPPKTDTTAAAAAAAGAVEAGAAGAGGGARAGVKTSAPVAAVKTAPPQKKTKSTERVTTTSVTLIDICVRAHALMSPVVGPGLEDDDVNASRTNSTATSTSTSTSTSSSTSTSTLAAAAAAAAAGSSAGGGDGGVHSRGGGAAVGAAAACALDLSVPLSRVTVRPTGGGFRQGAVYSHTTRFRST